MRPRCFRALARDVPIPGSATRAREAHDVHRIGHGASPPSSRVDGPVVREIRAVGAETRLRFRGSRRAWRAVAAQPACFSFCSATCFWISRLIALPIAPMKVGRLVAAQFMLASRFAFACWKRGIT